MPPVLAGSPSHFEAPRGSPAIIGWPLGPGVHDASAPRPQGRGGPASMGFEVPFPPSPRCPATLGTLRWAGSSFGHPHTVTAPESAPVLEPLGLLSGSVQDCSVGRWVTVSLFGDILATLIFICCMGALLPAFNPLKMLESWKLHVLELKSSLKKQILTCPGQEITQGDILLNMKPFHLFTNWQEKNFSNHTHGLFKQGSRINRSPNLRNKGHHMGWIKYV